MSIWVDYVFDLLWGYFDEEVYDVLGNDGCCICEFWANSGARSTVYATSTAVYVCSTAADNLYCR